MLLKHIRIARYEAVGIFIKLALAQLVVCKRYGRIDVEHYICDTLCGYGMILCTQACVTERIKGVTEALDSEIVH